MKFLAIFIVVLVYKNWVGGNPVRDAASPNGWFNWIKDMVAPGNLRFLVCVGLPCLALLWIAVEISDWLFGLLSLVLSVAVILYAVKPVDFDVLFDNHRLRLRSGEAAGDSAVQDNDDFCNGITYETFQSIVPALFWFLVLGPAGALLTVLTGQYLEQLDEDEADTSVADQLQYWLEWIPARLSGFIFALLGDFGHGARASIAALADIDEPVAVGLTDTMRNAIYREHAEAAQEGDWTTRVELELDELEALLARSVWGWVAFAALLTIVGW